VSNKQTTCGYTGLLSRVLPESGEGGTRGKLLTESFLFPPQ